MIPLSEIAPELEDPISGRPVQEIADEIEGGGVRRLGAAFGVLNLDGTLVSIEPGKGINRIEILPKFGPQGC